jgi:GNAT superfamily N-acetyltransferase
MEYNNLILKELSGKDADEIVFFAKQLNAAKSATELSGYLGEMFGINSYHCFGLYDNDKLLGISNGWVTVRFSSGRQLELDNVIVESGRRSKGLGRRFLELLENWAARHSCKTIELNAYTQNSRAHKFYYHSGYVILGFHFQKCL